MTQTFEYTHHADTHSTSSFVDCVCYNANKNLLGVVIVQRDYLPRVYVYSGVSLNEYHDLINSDSVGAAYNSFRMKNANDYALTNPQMKMVASDSDATGAATPKGLVDNTVSAASATAAAVVDSNRVINLYSDPVADNSKQEREYIVHFELYGRSRSAAVPADSLDNALATVGESLDMLGLQAKFTKVEVYL